MPDHVAAPHDERDLLEAFENAMAREQQLREALEAVVTSVSYFQALEIVRAALAAVGEPSQDRGDTARVQWATRLHRHRRRLRPLRSSPRAFGHVHGHTHPTRSRDAMSAEEYEIVRVSGRWATLSDGRIVTPVPPFRDLRYDGEDFGTRIARFQADPAGYIAQHGIVAETRTTRPAPADPGEPE